ncbi:sec14p-like phosphatidylinositol transfer family protein [Artemisia annua]|uniref:Sec14p-like phosphatidylinositol transfer family protein n=1 Tax=Artemisia annua TaxID=35608 RepID=A0A2U1PD09_ARTAN|nr:sec14p-like phosphatidylinositol transfer family protein [Artemisia annua]
MRVKNMNVVLKLQTISVYISNFKISSFDKQPPDFDVSDVPVEKCEYQVEQVNELKAALGPLIGRNSLYCADACLRRYLEARNWNVDKAKICWKKHLCGDQPISLKKFVGHEVAVEGEIRNYLEPIFLTKLDELSW